MQPEQKQLCGHKDALEKTILIVEDDECIGEMLVEALSLETPYKALLVSDGFQALGVVQHMKPDLFITDYRLPRMNGIELYDRLSHTDDLADTPTIIMSAYLPVGEVKKRHLIGLNKPFDVDELLETVEKLIK